MIYDEYDDGLDEDVIEEGEVWSWTGGVSVPLPDNIENNTTVRHVYTNGSFKYYHAPASSEGLVKFKLTTVENEEIKGCVWRRAEYKRQEQVWRKWAYRGAVGVHGEGQGGDDDDEDEDEEISFKPQKGVRVKKN